MQRLQTSCAICGRSSTYKCSACKNVYYCSKQHQKKDWKRHAESCRTFKIAEDSALGRHYIATRNIKVGEIVLKDELPLIAGPMVNCVPLCLGCYTVLDKSIAVPCARCGWPLCQNCKVHGLECDFTCSHRDSKVSITKFGYPHPSYQCINVIRALSLKHTDPESYKKLLSFESHYDKIKDKRNFIFEEASNIICFIKRFFKADDIEEEEITQIIGILQVNGHEVPLTDPPYVAVYELASLLEHNCRANCSKSFTDQGGLIIHAATSIAKGDHISICYTDALWGTVNRRHHLLETKFFECICKRCDDPTEFGTMFNAIKCNQINCSDFMLPETFLDQRQRDYKCSTCKSIVSYEEVDKMLEKIGIHLSSMKKNDIMACKKFLHSYTDILHPLHFYNIDVIIAVCQLIGQQDGGLPAIKTSLLIEKVEICRKLVPLLKHLVPAENRIRGMILFELHAALAELSKRYAEMDVAVSLLVESRMYLIDSWLLLQYEPKLLPEGQIASCGRKNLEDLNNLLKRFNRAEE
ncbi:SET domain-containing protein SmydA-8, isoform A [Anthophora retusa]